jgi:hypothetical protein
VLMTRIERSSVPSETAYALSLFHGFLTKDLQAYIVLLRYPKLRRKIVSLIETYQSQPDLEQFQERFESLLELYRYSTADLTNIDLDTIDTNMVDSMRQIRDEARRLLHRQQNRTKTPVSDQQSQELQQTRHDATLPVSHQEPQQTRHDATLPVSDQQSQKSHNTNRFSISLLLVLLLLIWIAPAGYSNALTITPVTNRSFHINQLV